MDELVRGLAALAVGVLTLAGPVLALLAYLRGRRLAVRVRLLEASVARLEAAAATGHAVPVEAAVPPEPLPEPEPAAVATPPRRRLPSLAGLEARVAQRWLVWLGALALGLGALFVAGWAVEQGLVGPQVRVLGAALLGFALLGLGERARRGQAAAGNDLVAPALAAGGLCAALRRGAGGAPRLRAGRAGRRLPAAGAGLGPGCRPRPAVRAAGRDSWARSAPA